MSNTTDMELDLQGLFESNTTYDYSDYTYKDDCVPVRASRVMAVLIPVVYSLALFVGLLGNGLVLGTVFKVRRWTPMGIFVLHISLADILLLLTMPLLDADASMTWGFGTGLCMLTTAMFKISFYCSIFLLVCISLDRYLSVVHKVQMFSERNSCRTQLIFIAVWIISLLLSIPDWLYLTTTGDALQGSSRCIHSHGGGRLASHVLTHLGFLIPAVVILCCCFRTILWLKCDPQAAQKRRPIFIIFVMALVFIVSWAPFNIALIVDTAKHSESTEQTEDCGKRKWTVLSITAALAVLHACVNPLIYISISRTFRRWVLAVFTRKGCAGENGVLSLWDLSTEDKDASVSPEEKSSLKPTSDTGQSIPMQQTDKMLC